MNRILFVPVFLLLISCQMFRKKNTEKIVREWQRKEILIPPKVEYKILGRDTLCSDLWYKQHKIFTYVDSIGCTSCQLGLPEWKMLIDSCSQQQMDVGFIFVIHSSNFRQFSLEVQFNGFDYPLIYDYHNSFDRLNHFPPTPYRTFLLDKNNKVLLVGSPVNNQKMWELYKNIITQSK
ncbi:MAG: hypothetical protein LBM08_14310 [Dysgonamonadaceae bacterium]|nr:hypothetical protein [Dysgonamonadaceae bacterium]